MQPSVIEIPNRSIVEDVDFTNGIIANKNRIYLIGRITEYDEDDEEIRDSETRKPIFKYQRDAKPEEQLQLVTTLTGYTTIETCMSYKPTEEFFIYAGDEDPLSIVDMEIINEKGNGLFESGKSRCIDGNIHFAVSHRLLLVRNEERNISSLSYDMYKDTKEPDYSSEGFSDIDAFNKNHIYAVGGEGDVWRYVDGIWTKCGFPTNLDLENVCCGEDGLVYISGLEGMTYVGKEDNWTALENPELSIPFKDVAWYDGKVWATNDYGTYWITPNGVVEADIPNDAKICSGGLHVNAGMLLLVGYGGAALLDSGEWRILI